MLAVRVLVIVTVVLVGGLGSGMARAFETAARAAILLDFRSGEVLFEKNADEALPPASMSKLMTAFMVFERLQQGSLALEDLLPVSEKAWRMGGSQMFVEVGERVAVRDLLQGIIVQSGNDACVVVAEALAGSEQAFAEQMTARAQEIGLTHSRFQNAHGLDTPGHEMSVRDLATLATLIIGRFPDYYLYYSQREYTYADITQRNRNPLLQAEVEGVDGLKTGFTEGAGYGLVASADREGRRLVLVVAGLDAARERRSESERLLEHGFRDFEEYRLFQAGETVAEAAVWQGKRDLVGLMPAELVAVTIPRGTRSDVSVRVRHEEPLTAPVALGQKLGDLVIDVQGRESQTVDLVAADAVERAGAFGRIAGALGYLVRGGG